MIVQTNYNQITDYIVYAPRHINLEKEKSLIRINEIIIFIKNRL